MKTASYEKWPRLFERLVGPEADDGQSEGVHGQFVILDRLAEDVGDAGGPLLPPELGVIRGIGEDLLELDARRIRRLAQVVENDVFDRHVDERERTVFGVIGDDVVFGWVPGRSPPAARRHSGSGGGWFDRVCLVRWNGVTCTSADDERCQP